MEKAIKVFIFLSFVWMTSAASASNAIQSIDYDFSGFVFLAHCFADDQLVVNEGETIRLLVKLPDPGDEKIHLINKLVGQVRATGVTSGYEYIGSVMIAALDLPETPYPHSDNVNIVNGRGAGVFLANVEWIAPSFPEVGVSMVKLLLVVTFEGDGAGDAEIAAISFDIDCKGSPLI